MAGQTVVAPSEEWADDDWEDIAPMASQASPADAALNDKFAAWLKSQGADEATVARGLEEAAKVNEGNPSAETQLSMAGGMLGGNVGSGVGGAVGTLADGGSLEDAMTSGAKNFAVSKATGAVVNKLRPVASGWLQRMGLRSMKAAIKPDRGYTEKMAGAKRGGIAAMENEIAQTALDEGINPVRRSGLDKLQGKIDDVAAQREALIDAAPDLPVPKSGLKAMAAGRRSLKVMSRGDAPQDDIATVQKFLDDSVTSPRVSVKTPTATGAQSTLRDLTPKELAQTAEAGNDRLRGLFNGQSKNAEVQARLRVQRARTRALDEGAGTRPLSDKMRKLIDVRNTGNIATARAERNNPISLTDIISLSAARPAVFAGSVGMKAPIQADLANLMNRTGKSLSGAPSANAEALRRALLALITTSVSPSAGHEQ